MPKGSWVQCDSGPSVMTDMEKRCCLLPEQSPLLACLSKPSAAAEGKPGWC